MPGPLMPRARRKLVAALVWMHQRSGTRVVTPKKLGSRKNPPGVAAPGKYVMMT
jgi:poly(3-hydroxyalkanoate) synthetase